MRAYFTRKRNKSGYTLMEVLLAVALLVILAGVTVVSVTGVRKSLRMTELDSAAETIYMAAQNRMTELAAAGRAAEYQQGQAGVHRLGYVPAHALYPEKYGEDTLSFITSDDAARIVDLLLPEGCVDGELRGGSWVIEYDAYSASVYGVFYSETQTPAQFHGSPIQDARTAQLRESREARLADGAIVGFYGGDSVKSEPVSALSPEMVVINGELLRVVITCENPGELNTGDTLTAELTVRQLNAAGEPIQGRENVLRSTAVWKPSLARYYCEISLDDITTSALRFYRRCPNIEPGAYIELSATLASTNDLVTPGETLPQRTNSLFGYVPGEDDLGATDTAVIRAARHLQNLDITTAHVNFTATRITKAVQRADVYFNDTPVSGDWSDTYGNRLFASLQNRDLESYIAEALPGSDEPCGIIGLTVAETGSAGLFKTFAGKTLQGVRLIDARVSGSGSVGALAGRTSAGLTISDCRVYLSAQELGGIARAAGADRVLPLLTGRETGGLVGTASATLHIQNSFAATALNGSSAAGGLVGGGSAALSVSGSYADCYVSGYNAGGLVGLSRAGVSVQNCYAAGFVNATAVGAGLVAGVSGSTSLAHVYSVVRHLAPERQNNTAKSYGLAPTGSAVCAYYLRSAGLFGGVGAERSYEEMPGDEVAAQLGGSFTRANAAANSNPYNMVQEMALDTYAYPRLNTLPHYGDWDAQPESGLVYYELNNGVYGIYGSNINSLQSTGSVRADGYGLLFTEDPAGKTIPIEYQDQTGAMRSAVLYGDDAQQVSYKKNDYFLLPLPGAVVSASNGYTGSFYHRLVVNSDIWYYNPHFARSVARPVFVNNTLQAPQVPERVVIRSARQLNALSRYYDSAYNRLLRRGDTLCSLVQEMDINYGGYYWGNTAVTSQAPIGVSTDFVHSYNGNCHPITGLSLTAAAAPNGNIYSGLFGRNAGTLKNIVLASNVSAQGAVSVYLGCSGSGTSFLLNGNRVVGYVGALSAYNAASGVIANCASAGYGVQGYTYTGTTLYMGGFVGYNAGIVRNASAVTASVQVNTNRGNAYIGGFVGHNAANIESCYSISSMNVRRYTSGTVYESGFAGYNGSSIQGCYCSAAMVAAGNTVSYAFNAGADARGSYYLSAGTYEFVGTTAAYENTNGSATSAAAQTYIQMEQLAGQSPAAVSLYHSAPATAAYPFPAMVTNAAGEKVHYGDWPQEALLYDCGIFYWEHEVSGYNNGYHISYLGYSSDTQSIQKGSTLCKSHDDNGVISEYGYGYYYPTDDAQAPSVSWTGVSTRNAYHQTASEQLGRQIPGWTFVAYKTWDPSQEADPANPLRDGLYLDGKNAYGGNDYSAPNASMALTRTGTGEETGSIRFEFNPFFAEAMSVRGENGSYGSGRPGSEENTYRVRSAAQLQYINWNFATLDSATALTAANTSATNTRVLTSFPYLTYRWGGGTGSQVSYREDYYWVQSHDINGHGGNFTPLGCLFDANDNNTSSAAAFVAAFGGSYRGADYLIKNININSSSQTVGLFGITLGGSLYNIVLYSDAGGAITANTAGSNWYCLGGLVGFAASRTGASITNCTIAGYQVHDARRAIGYGGADVGGLIGATNINIENCTAVVDLVIDFTHDNNTRNVRVGGLVGCSRSERIRNCYTGGSITYNRNGVNTNVLVGGIVGGTYLKDTGNLSSVLGTFYSRIAVSNCYSYTDLTDPDLAGIRACEVIASRGETGPSVAEITATNCYFLAPVMPGVKNGSNSSGSSEGYSYAQMDVLEASGTLLDDLNAGAGGRFGTVTRTENGVEIPGKYSYPAGNAELNGKNFPFPTILTQSGKNVHYGVWRQVGLFAKQIVDGTEASASSVEMDVLAADRKNLDVLLSCYGTAGTKQPFTTAPALRFEDGAASSDIVTAALDWENPDAELNHTLTLTALREGQTTLTISYGDYELDIDITVTAVIQVSANPASLTVFPGEIEENIALTALDINGDPIPDIAWTSVSSAVDYADVDAIADPAANPAAASVKGLRAGDVRIRFIAAAQDAAGQSLGYTENGQFHAYTGETILSVTVVPTDSLGLSDNAVYNEVTLGEATSYTGAPVLYPDRTKAPLCLADLFLYGNENAALGEWTIRSITMTLPDHTQVPLTDADADGVYHDAQDSCALRLDALTALDARGFEYLPMHFWGTDTANEVTLTFQLGLGERLQATLALNVYPMNCTVTFLDDEENELCEPVSVPYRGDATALAPTVATEPGYEAGWDVNLGYVVSDLTAHAVISPCRYVITLDAAGGTVETPTTEVVYGGSYGAESPLPTPVYTGHTFAGWYYTDGENHETLVTDATALLCTEDHTLTARWTVNTFTLSFAKNGADATGGTAGMSFTYGVEQALTPNGFTRTGYTFAGWNTAADGGGAAYTDGQLVKNLSAENGAAVTLYAQWSPLPCEVSFELNYEGSGENPAPRTLYYGSAYSLPTPERGGYRLNNWNTAQNGTGTAVTAATLVARTDTHTLYAQWTPIHTVYFRANEGAGDMAPQVIDCGTTRALTANAMTRENYSFTGWNTKADGSGTAYADAASFPAPNTPGGSTELFARWTPTYHVRFDKNGGTGEMADQLFVCGVAQALTANANAITREHYRFNGWNTKTDGSGAPYADGANITADLSATPGAVVTLYAQWVGTYTVRFDANGGEGTMAEQTIDCGATAALHTNAFTRTDYRFKNWTDGNGGSYSNGGSFTAPNVPGGELTLSASWLKKITLYQRVTTFTESDKYVILSGNSALTANGSNVARQTLNATQRSGAVDAQGAALSGVYTLSATPTTLWTYVGGTLKAGENAYLTGTSNSLRVGNPGDVFVYGGDGKLSFDGGSAYVRYRNNAFSATTTSGRASTLTLYRQITAYVEE